MSIDVKVPDLGDGIESGDVLSVLVKEGDTVAVEQGIVELETDKAVAEVPSTSAGRVEKIHVQVGQTVEVGVVLVTLEAVDAAAESTAPTAPSPTEQEAPAPQETQAADTAEELPAEPPPAPQQHMPAPRKLAAPPATPTAKSASAGGSTLEADPAGTMAPAGPAVRRFAREVGIEIGEVTGSGPGGRITRDDVLTAVRSAGQSGPASEADAEAAPSDFEVSVPGEVDHDDWGPVRIDRVTKIRATIAKNMVESKHTAPHVTNFDDADITELEQIRQSSKADYADAGIKLTTMPFVMKAITQALKRHPVINASIDLENRQVIYKQYINVGIAVDTERGLMVPVVRHADRLSIPQMAQSLAEIAEKARTNKITVDEMRGGTFTISNLGAIGGTYSTPVINTPEVAILLIGRSRQMPVVAAGEIKIRLMMPLSLSYDHRLVDGAAAARFLNDIKDYLQAPGRLLLAP